MHHRTVTLLATALVAFPGLAQDDGAVQQPAEVPAALQRVLDADAEARPAAMTSFILDRLATNALFAGQYAGLRAVREDAMSLLGDWILDPPDSVDNADAFRLACMRALTDVVDGEPPETIMETLREISEDKFEQGVVRENAAFTMAKFGDRSKVDGYVKQARAMLEHDDPMHRARGHLGLARIHYAIREYAPAVTAYKDLLGLIEDGAAPIDRGLPTLYYNCACSMSLAGQIDDAIAYVEKALTIGAERKEPLSPQLLQTDMDIAALRGDPRFQALLAKHGIAAGEKKKAPAKTDGDTDGR